MDLKVENEVSAVEGVHVHMTQVYANCPECPSVGVPFTHKHIHPANIPPQQGNSQITGSVQNIKAVLPRSSKQ
jgi:hypothetical protein